MSRPSPAAGDIWMWSEDWTVILIEKISNHRWKGYCLDDGDVGEWWFKPGDMHRWRQLA